MLSGGCAAASAAAAVLPPGTTITPAVLPPPLQQDSNSVYLHRTAAGEIKHIHAHASQTPAHGVRPKQIRLGKTYFP